MRRTQYIKIIDNINEETLKKELNTLDVHLVYNATIGIRGLSDKYVAENFGACRLEWTDSWNTKYAINFANVYQLMKFLINHKAFTPLGVLEVLKTQ